MEKKEFENIWNKVNMDKAFDEMFEGKDKKEFTREEIKDYTFKLFEGIFKEIQNQMS